MFTVGAFFELALLPAVDFLANVGETTELMEFFFLISVLVLVLSAMNFWFDDLVVCEPPKVV